MTIGDAPSTGLLDDIAEGALDSDYYEVRGGRYSRSRSFSTWRSALVLGIFGLLVTIAAMQTIQNRSANQAERSALEASIIAVRNEIADNNAALEDIEKEISALQRQEDAVLGQTTARGLAGYLGVEGPGVSLAMTDGEGRVTVFDSQKAVNGLFGSGAEAVSVNGQRITTLSSIQNANRVVMVNYRALSEPYVVLAIGEDLESRFFETADGTFLRSREAVDGINLDSDEYDRLYIGPAPQNRVALKSAQTMGGE